MSRFVLYTFLFHDMLGRIAWKSRPGCTHAFYFMRRPVRLVRSNAFCFMWWQTWAPSALSRWCIWFHAV